MSEEFDGWVAAERKGNIVKYYVELFAPGQIEFEEGEYVLVRRAPIPYELTDAGREALK
jgi:hypothetical protein